MNASADGDIHDYWTNTPAYDALTLIGDSDVGVAVGIAGIIVAAYVAYSTAHSPKPSASKLFGNGVIAALAAGLSSYMLLVQIVSFDVAHWLNSFTGPLVTVHGMLFSAICAFTLQASSMSHVKAPKVAHVVFYLVGVIAFAVGFCASLLVLGFLATSKDTNLVEWLCLLGIFVGVIAIGYVTRLIARFTLDKKAGSRTSKGKAKDGSRGVVLKALGRTATMFVVFEIALRLIGGTLADSGPIYEFTEATAKQDDYSSRVVKLNVMLRTKHEKYVTESGETYETIEYGYDSYGVNNYVVGRDENGLIYLVSSSKLEEFKDHITVLKALYWAPNHSKSIRTHKLGSDGEVVRVCKKYLNNDTEAEHWIYSTREKLNGRYVYHYDYYYTLDGSLESRVRYEYDSGGNNICNTYEDDEGSLIHRFVLETDAFGARVAREFYKGDSATPEYRETRAPKGGWWRVYTDGNTPPKYIPD